LLVHFLHFLGKQSNYSLHVIVWVFTHVDVS
jgi:hypothetical protein